MDTEISQVGPLIKHWRKLKRLSQFDLAMDSGISTKHLSFVETGKSRPSRKLLSQLARVLGLTLQNQNALFLAAGYAPIFSEAPLGAESMSVIQNAIEHILDGHEPYPALVVDENYDILKVNQAFVSVVDWFLGEGSAGQFSNVYRLMFEDEGLQPFIKDWPLFESNLLNRLLQEANVSQNRNLKALYADLLSLREPSPLTGLGIDFDLPILNFTLAKGDTEYAFFSMLTTFGTPLDVTVQNLRIESMFPADAETAALLSL